MKKTVVIALTALMAFTLVGCSSSKDADEEVDIEKDVATEGTEWVETLYEEKATEDVSEQIADLEEQITELEEAVEDLEPDTAWSTEDLEMMESYAEEEISELESDIEALED